MLIINADDWGANKRATEHSHDCFKKKRITSASAMVFMEYSERASELALESGLDVGLHLNLTHRFTGMANNRRFIDYHDRISAYLRKNRYTQIIYNPFLSNQFEYVLRSQWDEYLRLYHMNPTHINGHWHMHLCMNIVLSDIIPKGILVRRNFSFLKYEKSYINRTYRHIIDVLLVKKYYTTDYFFSIVPISFERIRRIVALAKDKIVELMVHPENNSEYVYILSSEFNDFIYSTSVGNFADTKI